MGDGMLSLSWNNHKATFCHILTTLREKERFTDATVACEGRFYQVHKLVLSTCSEYFEKMFDNTPCKHPVIVLKDIASDELEALLSYMYDGVVSVAQNDLARLIKAAEVLRIKGLAVPDEPPPPPPQRNDVSRRSAQSRNASDDRSSPHPKRRRRDENIPSQSIGHSSPISSPRASPALSDVDLSRTQTDTRWSEHSEDKNIDRSIDDRLRPSATSSGSHQSGEVLVDETLVKEEIDDSADNRDDLLDSGMDYGSLGSDSRLDGSLGGDGENSSSQIGPTKFEKSGSHSQAQNQQLPEAVVEALAGPSGMQGWLGGCEAPGGGFSGMEGYSGEGSSQDMHPPQQGPPGVQSQAHQMVGLGRDIMLVSGKRGGPPHDQGSTTTLPQTGEELSYPKRANEGQNLTQNLIHMTKNPGSLMKLHRCRYCNYTTNFTTNLINHMRTHTGEKPFSCPHCPYRANQRTNLTMHMRTHTGEKPYACEFCPYRSTRKDALRVHMLRHTTLTNVVSGIEDLTHNY